MTLFAGTALDTPEKRAEALAEGLERVKICINCDVEFYSPKGQSPICWTCWYSGQMKTAESSFGPLAEALERRLEVKTEVDQTGGMVMCLRIPIGNQSDEETARYAYFGEYPLEGVGFGLYMNWEDEGIYHDWPGEWTCHAGDCRWYHHPELCEQVAEWATPIIVRFATTGEVVQ